MKTHKYIERAHVTSACDLEPTSPKMRDLDPRDTPEIQYEFHRNFDETPKSPRPDLTNLTKPDEPVSSISANLSVFTPTVV